VWLNCNGKFPIRRFFVAYLQSLNCNGIFPINPIYLTFDTTFTHPVRVY
jgi:hypothetical protein